MNQAAEAFIGLDFANERELYESILTLSRSLDLMLRDRLTKVENQKLRGRVEHLSREIERKSQWYDRTANKRVVEKLGRLQSLWAKNVVGRMFNL